MGGCVSVPKEHSRADVPELGGLKNSTPIPEENAKNGSEVRPVSTKVGAEIVTMDEVSQSSLHQEDIKESGKADTDKQVVSEIPKPLEDINVTEKDTSQNVSSAVNVPSTAEPAVSQSFLHQEDIKESGKADTDKEVDSEISKPLEDINVTVKDTSQNVSSAVNVASTAEPAVIVKPPLDDIVDDVKKIAKLQELEYHPGSVLERHNVVVMGEGPETLFLSHGFGTNQQIWAPVLEQFDLVNKYRVVLWDLMGAYSTNPDGFNFQRYSTLHGYADDLLEVLDELELEEITYIGHSVSGMLGVICCIERPDVFKRLIFIGASPRYLDLPDYHGGFTLEMLDQVFAAMQENYRAWASGFSPLVIGEDVDSASVREFCRSLFLIRPDIAFSTLKTIFTADMRSLLPQVKNQIHLLQTSKDAAVPWEPVQYMLDHFPNAVVEIIPVAGHLPHLTHPKTVADALLRHLNMPDRPIPLRSESSGRDPIHSGRSTVGDFGSGRVNGNGDLVNVENLMDDR